ncbi:MAG: glycosyltransferase family 39 protein, partial [Chloroflexia bacterium]
VQRILGRRRYLRLVGITAAMLLTVGSLVAWWQEPQAVFGWQGVLWLAGMVVFVASCARWPVAQGRVADREPWSRAEWLVFAGVVGLALASRLLWLDEIPWRFHYDEAIAYSESMRFYKGPPISVFTVTWHNTSLPSLLFAYTGGVMNLVGTGLGGGRFGVALLGALAVLPVYGLGRLLGGPALAAFSSVAWATSAVAVHYSRVSLLNITTACLWAACFFFLLRGMRSRRPLDFALSGLAGGLSMYTYYATRLLPFVLVAFIAYLAIFHRARLREMRGQLGLLAAGFFVGFGPLLAFFIRNPEMWAGRGLNRLTIPHLVPTSWAELAADWNALLPLLWRNLLGFTAILSNDHVYWGTFLIPVEGALLVIGSCVLLYRWRRPGAFLVLLWAGSVLLVGGTLIDAAHIPAFAHWTPAFPALYLALGLPLALLYEALAGAPDRLRAIGRGATIALAGALAVSNVLYYVLVYPARVPPAFESAQGRLLESLSETDRVRFVGNSWQGYYPEIGRLMAPHVRASDLYNPALSLPVVGETERDLTFVFNSDETQYLPFVMSLYPGGTVAPMETAGGNRAAIYSVKGTEAQSQYGVLVELKEGVEGQPAALSRVERIGALPPGVRYPLRATWEGAVFMERSGQVRFRLEGGQEATLTLNAEEVAFDTLVEVERGWNRFALSARLAAAEPVSLLVGEGNSVVEIPATHVWPVEPGQGLAVTLDTGRVSHRIMPLVGVGLMNAESGSPDPAFVPSMEARDPDFVPMAAPGGGDTRMKLEGEVWVEAGTYLMELRTDGHARLWIDDELVVDGCAVSAADASVPIVGGLVPVSGTATMSEGWHRVRLDFEATGTFNGLEWTWTRPDGTREIVPPSRLRYVPGSWPQAPQRVTCEP